MYRIINDKRVISTKERLYSELQKCNTKEEFNSLTVSKLCENAQISRASFYRSFDNITDLLDYKIFSLLSEFKTQYAKTHPIFVQDEFFHGLINIYLTNNHPIRLAAAIGKIDIIHKNVVLLCDDLYKHYNFTFSRDIFDFCIGLLVSVAIGGLYYWKEEIHSRDFNLLLHKLKASVSSIIYGQRIHCK